MSPASSLSEKLLGINFDYQLNLAKHIKDIWSILKAYWSIKKVKFSYKINTIYDVIKKTYSNECFLQVAI